MLKLSYPVWIAFRHSMHATNLCSTQARQWGLCLICRLFDSADFNSIRIPRLLTAAGKSLTADDEHDAAGFFTGCNPKTVKGAELAHNLEMAMLRAIFQFLRQAISKVEGPVESSCVSCCA